MTAKSLNKTENVFGSIRVQLQINVCASWTENSKIFESEVSLTSR